MGWAIEDEKMRRACLSPLRLPQQTALAWRSLEQETFISHGPGGWQSKTKVPSNLESGEDSRLCLQRVAFLLCLHMAFVERGSNLILSSFSHKATNPIRLGLHPYELIYC